METVEFTEVAVREYLDDAIHYWRTKRDQGDTIAPCYIDAYQSVRMSLFGETLSPETEVT